MKKERGLQKENTRKSPSISGVLIEDLRSMIENTRQSVASAINASITALYWNIGHRIHMEILREERAEYGKTIVASLMRQLSWSISLC